MRKLKHDVIVVGSGLAGFRAAIEAAKDGNLDVGIISKVQLMRSHSVCAEGGTAAVMQPDQGDSLELHAWDTVRGADFLADQNVVMRFVEEIPSELRLLEHWGIPWSRRKDGRMDQRPFGGHSFDRATFAADKTGFFEMQTLYDTLQKYDNITRYDECYVYSILKKGDQFCGVTVWSLTTGEFFVVQGKSLIIATGGACRMFGFTTYSLTATGDVLDRLTGQGCRSKNWSLCNSIPPDWCLPVSLSPRLPGEKAATCVMSMAKGSWTSMLKARWSWLLAI
jgi:succinate dehydrogenase / fumarate reductase flavoprotein subunit